MRKGKFLILAVAGMAMSILLTTPVFASGSVAVSITDITDAEALEDAHSDPKTLSRGEAVPYPTDIQLMEHGARNYLYKTYTVAADYSPDSLVESPFSQGGYRFRYSETIQRSHTPGNLTKTVVEQKTMDSASGEKADILDLLGSSIPYADNDGYKGEIFLVPESLIISENGHENYSYTIADTRTFDNLERNDPSYVPKSVQKNGVTLTLQGIDWSVTANEGVGYSEVASRYIAIASYSGVATGSKVSAYTATAAYSGNVVKEGVGKSSYTIVYEGEQIIIPFNFVPLIIAGVIVAGCIVICIVLWMLRKNVEVYIYRDGVPEFYCKDRIKPNNAVIKLTQLHNANVKLVFHKKLAAALTNHMVYVNGKIRNVRFVSNGDVAWNVWIGDDDINLGERIVDIEC